MKSLFAFASVFALSVVPALAGEGRISNQTLAKMGLAGMQSMSDADGMGIRGLSATAGGFSIVTFGSAGSASSAYYANGHQSAAGFSVSAGAVVVNNYPSVALFGGASSATTH